MYTKLYLTRFTMFPCVSFRANAHVTVLLVQCHTFPIVLTRPFETCRLEKTHNNEKETRKMWHSVHQHKSPIILYFLFLQIESLSLIKLSPLIIKFLCKSSGQITSLPTSAINHSVLLPLRRNLKRKTHGLNYTDARSNQLAFRRIIKKNIKKTAISSCL